MLLSEAAHCCYASGAYPVLMSPYIPSLCHSTLLLYYIIRLLKAGASLCQRVIFPYGRFRHRERYIIPEGGGGLSHGKIGCDRFLSYENA